MNIIEVIRIARIDDKLRRKEWGVTGSRGASILFLYKQDEEKLIPIYHQSARTTFKLSTFLITEDYIADDWEVME